MIPIFARKSKMVEATHLASLAMRDSIHDFDTSATMLYDVIMESLPATSIDFIHDDDKAIDYARQKSSRDFLELSAMPDQAFKQLGGTRTKPIAILCDASMCANFVSLLSKNSIGKVIALRNREEKNDPGTNCTDTTFREKGITLVNDMPPSGGILYPKYMNQGNINTKFFSTYAITLLEGKTQIGTKTYDASQNEVNKIDIIIKDYIKRNPLDLQKPIVRRNIAHRFIQKRSGDFLQALSCADMDRNYIIDGIPQNLKNHIVYFCSSDRVPIAYCLYLGINCIYKTQNSYKFFHNPMSLMNSSTRDYMDLFIDRSKKETLQKHVRDGMQIYDTIAPQLLNEMTKIRTVENIATIPNIVKYAILYSELVSYYYQVKHNRNVLESFLENPNNLTNESDHRTIVYFVRCIEEANAAWGSIQIHSPLQGMKAFPYFDPTEYYIRRTGSTKQFGIVYGQAILRMLYRSNQELSDFVEICIEKIMNFITDPMLYTHYSVFLGALLKEKGKGITRGGSNDARFSKTHLRAICDYLMDHIQYYEECYNEVELEMYELPICLNIEVLSGDTVCYHTILYIIQQYNIKYMPFAEKIENMAKNLGYNALRDDYKQAYAFLKSLRSNHTLRMNRMHRMPSSVMAYGGSRIKRRKKTRKLPRI